MGYSDEIKTMMTERTASLGCEFPLNFDDIHEMWRAWTGKSAFAWESSGFPYWSHLHHAQTWWDFRHLPNILLVHFADLLEDPEGQIRRVARYLDIEIDEELLPGVLKRISFSSMKENFGSIFPEAQQLFRGGGETFMNKGTNGRWQGILNEAELQQCREAIERELTPDCASWLEQGGVHRITSAAAASA
jgi:aryl sulfotransferase